MGLAPALVLALLAVGDTVHVEAHISPERIVVGDATTLTITVSIQSRDHGSSARLGGASIPFQIPSLPSGLGVAGTQEFSQFQSSLTGPRTWVTGRRVTLVAFAPGEYALDPASVTVDGAVYRSAPLRLSVLANPRAVGSEDEGVVTLRAWLDPDTVYVGQQVSLRAEALFPGDLRVRQVRPPSYEAPSPAGFWIQDLPNPTTVETRLEGTRRVEVQGFRRAYFPLSSGQYTLPPARFSYELRRGYMGVSESRQLTSDSLRLTVLPLPAAGRPPSFHGAVGRFQVSASLSPATVTAGDATSLTVQVSGVGNVKSLPPPDLPPLADVRVYPPAEDAEVDATSGQVTGWKRFTWVIVPTAPGPVQLPAVEYAAFDPEARRYTVVRSAPLRLEVRPAAAGAMADTTLRPLHRWTGSQAPDFVRSSWFLGLQVVPLLLVGVVLLMTRRRRRPAPTRPRRMAWRERQAVARAIMVAGGRNCYPGLAQSIRDGIAEILDIPPPAQTDLGEALTTAGAGEETRGRLEAFLARLDAARFAPTPLSAPEREALAEEGFAILEQLASEVPEQTHTMSAATALLVALLLVPGILRAGEAVDPSFTAGMLAFDRQDYPTAVRHFTSYVDRHPDDGEGWYDLGNAHFRLGNEGDAVWAWLRALALAPRNVDARHNLAIAGVRPAQAGLPAWRPLSVPEMAILATGFWWLTGLCLAGFLWRRRRALKWAGLVALSLTLLLGGVAAARHWARPLGIVLPEHGVLVAGPVAKGEPVGQVAGGDVLTILQRSGSWLLTRDSDGHEGWIETELVGLLPPH